MAKPGIDFILLEFLAQILAVLIRFPVLFEIAGSLRSGVDTFATNLTCFSQTLSAKFWHTWFFPKLQPRLTLKGKIFLKNVFVKPRNPPPPYRVYFFPCQKYYVCVKKKTWFSVSIKRHKHNIFDTEKNAPYRGVCRSRTESDGSVPMKKNFVKPRGKCPI